MSMKIKKTKNGITVLLAVLVLSATAACKNEPSEPDVRQPVINSASASSPTLQLPDDTEVTLTVSATSADGKPAKAYSWELKETDPAGLTANIGAVNPDGSVTVTGLTVAGEYTFEVTVTGNNDVTAPAEVIVTVKADARQPTFSIGSNNSIIRLPTDSVTLDSDVNDPDDNLAGVGYEWSRVTGSTSAQITTPNGASTTVTGMSAGQYTFQLAVVGSNGVAAAAPKTVGVDVLEALAVSASTTTDLPVSFATDDGVNVSLNAGTISNKLNSNEEFDYLWSAAPSDGVSFADATSPNATATITQAGNYQFTLKVTSKTNSHDAVSSPVLITANDARPPIINSAAPSASLIYAPAASTVNLSVEAESADGSAATYEWTLKSTVPADLTATISNDTQATANVSALNTAGTYVFEVEVKGSNGITKTQEVTVVVGIETTLNFPTLSAGPSLNFAPIETLPAGVTYIITDNREPQNVWNSAAPEFTGTITVAEVNVGPITFTQTFYLYGKKVSDIERIVTANVVTFPSTQFASVNSDKNFVELRHP